MTDTETNEKDGAAAAGIKLVADCRESSPTRDEGSRPDGLGRPSGLGLSHERGRSDRVDGRLPPGGELPVQLGDELAHVGGGRPQHGSAHGQVGAKRGEKHAPLCGHVLRPPAMQGDIEKEPDQGRSAVGFMVANDTRPP